MSSGSGPPHTDPEDMRRSVDAIPGRQFTAPEDAVVSFGHLDTNGAAAIIGVEAGDVSILIEAPGFVTADDLAAATTDDVLDRVATMLQNATSVDDPSRPAADPGAANADADADAGSEQASTSGSESAASTTGAASDTGEGPGSGSGSAATSATDSGTDEPADAAPLAGPDADHKYTPGRGGDD